MSTPTTTAPEKAQAAPARPRTKLTWPLALLLVAGLLLLVSVVRLVTGADGITSTGQMSAALRLAVPIGLAGLGGLWAERAGVVNIGLGLLAGDRDATVVLRQDGGHDGQSHGVGRGGRDGHGPDGAQRGGDRGHQQGGGHSRGPGAAAGANSGTGHATHDRRRA